MFGRHAKKDEPETEVKPTRPQRGTHPIFFDRIDPGTSQGPAAADTEICGSCHWHLLGEMSGIVASISPDFDATLLSIVRASVRLVDGDRGLLMLVSEDGKLNARVSHNLTKDELSEANFKPSLTIIHRVLKKRQGIALPEIITPEHGGSTTESVMDLGIRSAMCVPLMLQAGGSTPHQQKRARAVLNQIAGMIGVIYVDSVRVAEDFDPYELDVLQSLANQASGVLLGAAYYQQATTDGLTQCASAGHFGFRMEEEVTLAIQENHPLAVCLIDVDKFKDVNDTHGHAAGDRLLTRVAQELKRASGKDDVVGRLGGDEFGVLMPGRTTASATAMAEAVRASVEAMRVPVRDGPEIGVTLSIGVAAFPDVHGDVEKLRCVADTRLYEAKDAGRNRVVPAV